MSELTPAFSTAEQADHLPDPQRLAIQAMIGGASRADASAAAGIATRTLQRWLKLPDFRAALNQARCDAWTDVTSELHAQALHAVRTLNAVMDCDQPRARVAAARALLQLAGRALELETLFERMAQVEADLEHRLGAEAHGEPPDDAGTPPESQDDPKVSMGDPWDDPDPSRRRPTSPGTGAAFSRAAADGAALSEKGMAESDGVFSPARQKATKRDIAALARDAFARLRLKPTRPQPAFGDPKWRAQQ